MSYTALHSDYVLPAATWYEYDDIPWTTPIAPFAHATTRVVEPLGEAVLLSVLGGSLGLLVVFALVLILQATVPDLPVALQPVYMVLSMLLSCGVGLTAGIAPAMRAASVDPIEALRAE